MFRINRADVEYKNRRACNVNQTNTEKVADWMADFEHCENMSIYGGDISKRNRIILEAISRCYGNVGIIIIHNNMEIGNVISMFPDTYPDIFDGWKENGFEAGVIHVGSYNPIYSPLHGMDKERIVEAIYPRNSNDNPAVMQQNMCAEALKCYIDVLTLTGKEVCLSELHQVCNKEIDEIFASNKPKRAGRLGASAIEEDDSIPDQEKSRILSVLKRENIYFQVRADVNAFADHLNRRIYSSNTQNTRISMIEAIRNKGILTINVPSNDYVVEYLSSELNQIKDWGMQFLLIIDSVYVGDTSLCKNILMAPNLPFSVVLVGDNIQGIFGNQGEANDVFHKMNKIVIMNTANVTVAQVYSEMIGRYMRIFMAEDDGRNRGAFDLFSGTSSGRGIHEELFERIRPEEFTQLGNGAVLISQGNQGQYVAKTQKLVVN